MNTLALLQEKGVVDASVAQAVQADMQTSGKSAEAVLLERGVDPDAVLGVLADYYKLPTYRLGENEKITPQVLKYLSEDSARHYHMLPLSLRDGVIEIGVTNPDDLSALDALNFIAAKNKLPYKLVLILERDLERGLALYENLTGEVENALTELESELSAELKKREEEPPEESSGEFIKEDAPVTKIVATILRYAVDGRASDIHIEPVASKVHVRFRVDGVLVMSLELPLKVHSAVVARVKILTSMRLDERRKPQDGRFSATIDGRKIDFRVSTLPTQYGEKVVMRILDPESGVHTIEETGISAYNLEMIRKAVRAPYGIVLISGPTGSGKTTTLYGMLSEVDRAGQNVLSLEDPIEYNIDGVSQSQVRPEIGYTFASGLRSVLRQDPDVIMVGEIRDKETAQLAIQAALTGHLVLSTIHTNNAIGVVPRLIDMGVDPYLIAPTLVLAIAQRLVLRICPGTGKKVPVEGSVKMMIDHEFESLPAAYHARIPKADFVLGAERTGACPNGTRGRTAVMEVVEINDEMRELILTRGSEEDMYKVARKNGFITMKEDAIIKALEHSIPFEEVNTLGGTLLEPDMEEDTVDNPSAQETESTV
ncbi:type II/IV secretion system protein [Candidatus Kaiserbacteria bacterium]|nr:type II/IV secretion system protein [Candidatus Kaiserbacteria bacterium]